MEGGRGCIGIDPGLNFEGVGPKPDDPDWVSLHPSRLALDHG